MWSEGWGFTPLGPCSPNLGEVARAFLVRVTELCGAAFLAEESILFTVQAFRLLVRFCEFSIGHACDMTAGPNSVAVYLQHVCLSYRVSVCT